MTQVILLRTHSTSSGRAEMKVFLQETYRPRASLAPLALSEVEESGRAEMKVFLQETYRPRASLVPLALSLTQKYKVCGAPKL
jgi:hypothetical protein